MTELLKASVIIPTHNRCEILKRVLQCYKTQTILNNRFELVVIDDGGSDDTKSIFNNMQLSDYELNNNSPIKRYRDRIESVRCGDLEKGNHLHLEYIKIKKSGRSVARNIGIGFAHNALIIFADDDIFIEPEFIEKHIAAHYPDDMQVVTGRVIHTNNIENPLSARWKLKDINTSFLATGNASVFKDHIVRAGLFDENYRVYGWEDFDLGIHLEQNGLKSVRKRIYGYHFAFPQRVIQPEQIYNKEKERGFTAVYFYKEHPLKWIKRFTLVKNRLLDTVFQYLGRKNWFLKKDKISRLKGFSRLIIRYKGYFDGVRDGKRHYMSEGHLESRG